MHVGLEVALPEGILALERGDRVHRVRPPDGLDARLRQAEEARLALRHQVGHRADDVLDRDLRVYPVLVQQVDPVGLEPPERSLHRFPDVRRSAVEPAAFLLVDLPAELGRDDRALAPPGQRPPEQRLVGVRSIYLGRIEERHAQLEGAVNGGDGLLVVRRAVGLAHAHAPEPEGGNLESLGTQSSCRQHRHAPLGRSSPETSHEGEKARRRAGERAGGRAGGRAVGQSGGRAVGQLSGSWAVGQLGSRAVGQSGSRAVGQSGSRAVGQSGQAVWHGDLLHQPPSGRAGAQPRHPERSEGSTHPGFESMPAE